jgi:hypothetical protein
MQFNFRDMHINSLPSFFTQASRMRNTREFFMPSKLSRGKTLSHEMLHSYGGKTWQHQRGCNANGSARCTAGSTENRFSGTTREIGWGRHSRNLQPDTLDTPPVPPWCCKHKCQNSEHGFVFIDTAFECDACKKCQSQYAHAHGPDSSPHDSCVTLPIAQKEHIAE